MEIKKQKKTLEYKKYSGMTHSRENGYFSKTKKRWLFFFKTSFIMVKLLNFPLFGVILLYVKSNHKLARNDLALLLHVEMWNLT